MADTSLIALGAGAGALAVVFGGIAIKAYREHRQWCARGTRAEGVVSRLVERRGHGLSEDAAGMPTDAAATTVPVVRFRTADGLEYEIDAPDAPTEIGSRVEIAFEPGQPSAARAVERPPKIGCAVVLLAVGIVLLAVGLSR
jgi:hypothetical protein